MNIFILDKNPEKSAEYLCDKHVCKMIVESCQILCSVFYCNSTKEINIPYKLTHENHPCCIWARHSRLNFNWLLQYTQFLLKQYELRYNKIHKCNDIISWVIEYQQFLKFRFEEITTPFVLAMPEKYKCEDAVESYRKYYISEKLHFAKWRYTNIPEWVSCCAEFINKV